MISTKLIIMNGVLALITLVSITSCITNKKKSFRSPSSLVGKPAPLFTFVDQMGVTKSISDLQGTKVALCFYPKDKSPFCTKQLCSIRDGFALLQKEQIQIIALSPDSEKQHQEFTNQQHFPFLLISDRDKKIAHLYHATGGWFGLLKRITVLIDEKGIVVAVLENIDINNHAQQIINTFKLKP